MGVLLAVYDLVLVEVDERCDDLKEIVLDFHFCQSFSTLYQLVQRLVRADLQQNIHVLMVLEDVFEFDYIMMTKRFVNLYFGDELCYSKATFCLARERLRELLAMILAADIFRYLGT